MGSVRKGASVGTAALGLALIWSLPAAAQKTPAYMLTPEEIAGVKRHLVAAHSTLSREKAAWPGIIRAGAALLAPHWSTFHIKGTPQRNFKWWLDPQPAIDGLRVYEVADTRIETTDGRFVLVHACQPVFSLCYLSAAVVIDLESRHVVAATFGLTDPDTKDDNDEPTIFVKDCAPSELVEFARRRFRILYDKRNWKTFPDFNAEEDYTVAVPTTVTILKSPCQGPARKTGSAQKR